VVVANLLKDLAGDIHKFVGGLYVDVSWHRLGATPNIKGIQFDLDSYGMCKYVFALHVLGEHPGHVFECGIEIRPVAFGTKGSFPTDSLLVISTGSIAIIIIGSIVGIILATVGILRPKGIRSRSTAAAAAAAAAATSHGGPQQELTRRGLKQKGHESPFVVELSDGMNVEYMLEKFFGDTTDAGDFSYRQGMHEFQNGPRIHQALPVGLVEVARNFGQHEIGGNPGRARQAFGDVVDAAAHMRHNGRDGLVTHLGGIRLQE
jgi:hypothetical protein